MGIADEVREELKRAVGHGESITGIAERIGVNRVSLSRFASGDRGIALDTLEALANVLGLTLTAKPRKKRAK